MYGARGGRNKGKGMTACRMHVGRVSGLRWGWCGCASAPVFSRLFEQGLLQFCMGWLPAVKYQGGGCNHQSCCWAQDLSSNARGVHVLAYLILGQHHLHNSPIACVFCALIACRKQGVVVSMDKCMAWDDNCCQLRIARTGKAGLSTQPLSEQQEGGGK